ncbi:hypothetical protein BHM03_00029652 [Ensete ventricosum]|uniref:Uncharacterized protein n=1 Tax=Ensete ventricosum TaxID=4639 RepID=A0A427A8V9_ENSVE|nr:hypothetical protein B296_00020710 [Ensete ventricosum]RZS00019.1 hypothetical protein BHM03_00029652 [Ensete ventricosum]
MFLLPLETLSMKGLTLNCMDRKSEAYDLVRRGLKETVIHAFLQVQMRDLIGFVETRQQLLALKPNHRMNWIGFAVAHHLNSKHILQISLLEECGLFDRALEEMHKKEAKIVSLNSQYQTPFWCIKSSFTVYPLAVCLMSHQVDKLAFKEQMASIVLKLGHFEEAEKMYRFLLVMNPDNYRQVV